MKSLDLKSYMRVVVSECDDFLIAYVLTTGPKANQNPSFTWCNDLRVTANQIILHIFREQSRGLHTRLATVNHRRPFLNFSSGEGGLYTGYHCLADQLFASADSPLANHDILRNDWWSFYTSLYIIVMIVYIWSLMTSLIDMMATAITDKC